MLRGGGAKIIHHKIGHEMDGGGGGGGGGGAGGRGGRQRSCSRIAYTKLDSELLTSQDE